MLSRSLAGSTSEVPSLPATNRQPERVRQLAPSSGTDIKDSTTPVRRCTPA
ncbi:MAG TPA: hypothetical protein VGJ60_09010 [Chloroflexota bacterium]